jgi:hypothetical protein
MTAPLDRRQFLGRAAWGGAALAGLRFPAVAQAAAGPRWGDLVGRFLWNGAPPPRRRLKVDRDLDFCGKFDIRDESLLVGPEHGLAGVYVFLRSRAVPICPELAAAVPNHVTLDNRDCIFKPHCLMIWLDKQELRIINSDPIAQNVAFSPPGDAPANIVMPVGGKATYQFSRRQNVPVHIACNYHPWESGFILPRDNPYTAISAADGTFRIAKLPVGTWQFQAWQEQVGGLELPPWPKGRFTATIKPGANDLGTIRIEPAQWGKTSNR